MGFILSFSESFFFYLYLSLKSVCVTESYFPPVGPDRSTEQTGVCWARFTFTSCLKTVPLSRSLSESGDLQPKNKAAPVIRAAEVELKAALYLIKTTGLNLPEQNINIILKSFCQQLKLNSVLL